MKQTLILATRNAHKVEEIKSILGPGWDVRSLADYPAAPEVVEDAATFAGNASKKAVSLARWLSPQWSNLAKNGDEIWVLADDSGLEVDALNGAPGVYSARFSGLDTGVPGNSSTQANNEKLLRLLTNVPSEKRSGRFRCVLALVPVAPESQLSASPVCYSDEAELMIELFDGACEGRVGFEPKGAGGFGYDPLFYPKGHEQSFAQLGEAVKNEISHRARALLKLKAWNSTRTR